MTTLGDPLPSPIDDLERDIAILFGWNNICWKDGQYMGWPFETGIIIPVPHYSNSILLEETMAVLNLKGFTEIDFEYRNPDIHCIFRSQHGGIYRGKPCASYSLALAHTLVEWATHYELL